MHNYACDQTSTIHKAFSVMLRLFIISDGNALFSVYWILMFISSLLHGIEISHFALRATAACYRGNKPCFLIIYFCPHFFQHRISHNSSSLFFLSTVNHEDKQELEFCRHPDKYQYLYRGTVVTSSFLPGSRTHFIVYSAKPTISSKQKVQCVRAGP